MYNSIKYYIYNSITCLQINFIIIFLIYPVQEEKALFKEKLELLAQEN